ncbi:MAG: tRNA (N6-threonylcarbamoyladenosine(37)-N6)-methyltransferase TrmO [Sulfolobales archaeon]|jgi:tRNA-Thr(GGU) m(6)t(6)A37 methyltransferase TsaA
MDTSDVKIDLRPVGFVRVSLPDDSVARAVRGVQGSIEILPEYEEALEGIEGFSHIIVIAYLHKAISRRGVLRVRPRKFMRYGLSEEEIPEVGVFCTDSPHRPNPIAVSIVRLLKREGRILHVDGLDLFDGTPVLDIKPYTPSRRIEGIKLPEWYISLLEKIRRVCPEAVEI